MKAFEPKSGFLALIRPSEYLLAGSMAFVTFQFKMQASSGSVHVSLAEALAKGPPPRGNLAVPIFSHGLLVIELYTPTGLDPQKPHTRDEIYFVTRGKGLFYDGARRYPVEAGSFLFVAAGQAHRFEHFSSDFAVWVAFYGPEGGESHRSTT